MTKTLRSILILGAIALVVSGLASLADPKEDKQTPSRSDVLYTCGCGADCKCDAATLAAGTCKCGKPLVWGHVVRVDGDKAFVCGCKEGCTCKADPKDAAKCACGHALKTVSLKGTGVYYCNCGGSCTCNTLSDKPGKCHCGKELKKAE